MRNVKKAIEVVLASTQVTGQVTVVDPDVGRLIDTNSIAVGGINFCNLEVSENNVLLTTNVEPNSSKCCIASAEISPLDRGHGELTATSCTDDSLIR